MLTLAGFFDETVQSVIDGLLDWIAQAWEWFLGIITELFCPIITDLVNNTTIQTVTADMVNGWNQAAPYLSQSNYYVPVVESVAIFVLYQGWNVVWIIANKLLKALPAIW